MSEGIWVYITLIMAGMFVSLIFVMIGVVIERARVDYRSNKDVLHRDSDSWVGVHDRGRSRNGNNGSGRKGVRR